MGIFSEEVQKSSVTQYIESLSKKDEIDWWQFQQLVESMSMQESGCREAIEAIRKRLKHGDTHQKMRVLEILKLLTENSTPQFRRLMINTEKMRERFESLLTSPVEDIKVKKEVQKLLATWSGEYRDEGDIGKLAAVVYKSGTGRVDQTTTRARSGSAAPAVNIPVTAANTSNQSQPTSPSSQMKRAPPQPAKPSRQRSQSTAATGSSSQPPKAMDIQSEVTEAVKNINFLLNALKLINTSEDRWEVDLQHDARNQQLRENCQNSKKKIERYTRLVEDEEWIGTLVATNDDLLKALEMYDMMLVGQVPDTLPMSPSQDYQPHHRTAPPPPSDLPLTAYHGSSDDSSYPNLSTLQLSDRPYQEEEEDPFADPVENDGHRKSEFIL